MDNSGHSISNNPAYPLITPEHVVPAVTWLVQQIEEKMTRIDCRKFKHTSRSIPQALSAKFLRSQPLASL